MDKKYIELFKMLAQATAVSAEQVMEYDRTINDEKGLQTAKIMRDNFQELADRVDKDNYTLNKDDTAKLLVGALIQVNQLQDKINNFKAAMAGYEKDLIPKLQEIINKAKTDDEFSKLANEKFIVKDNE